MKAAECGEAERQSKSQTEQTEQKRRGGDDTATAVCNTEEGSTRRGHPWLRNQRLGNVRRHLRGRRGEFLPWRRSPKWLQRARWWPVAAHHRHVCAVLMPPRPLQTAFPAAALLRRRAAAIPHFRGGTRCRVAALQTLRWWPRLWKQPSRRVLQSAPVCAGRAAAQRRRSGLSGMRRVLLVSATNQVDSRSKQMVRLRARVQSFLKRQGGSGAR